MSRTVEIRKSANLNSDLLRIPFAYIHEQFGYSVDSILRPIHNQPKLHLGTFPDTFPNTIIEYNWIHTGVGSWMALGLMKDGLYFFYTADCKNTPRSFLDKGHMNLWISFNYGDLINFAMNKNTYDLYLEETPPITVLEDQIDATSQTFHQASDASELLEDAAPPAQAEQSHVDLLRARAQQYMRGLPGLTDLF